MQLFIEVVREKGKTDNLSNGKKRYGSFNKYKGRNGKKLLSRKKNIANL